MKGQSAQEEKTIDTKGQKVFRKTVDAKGKKVLRKGKLIQRG
jgi:hypothetical protein